MERRGIQLLTNMLAAEGPPLLPREGPPLPPPNEPPDAFDEEEKLHGQKHSWNLRKDLYIYICVYSV